MSNEYESNEHESRHAAYGFELPLLLFGGFRSIIDELHAELARRGHPDLRPAHGFALQAIGPHGATATEAGCPVVVWAWAKSPNLRLCRSRACLRI